MAAQERTKITMKMYKGFNEDMTCRGFQYEEGKEYEEKEADLCEKGFHACENPVDCLGYYPPGYSVYREVELNEISEETSSDSKRVGKEIKIGAKIDVADMVKIAFDYAKSNCTNDKSGGNYTALNGGVCSALNGGDYSALRGGDCSGLNGGDYSIVYGGEGARVKAGKHSVLAIQFWKNHKFIRIAFAEVDGEKIKEDTWYKLDENGEFTEVV
jgi:hypothetical protein